MAETVNSNEPQSSKAGPYKCKHCSRFFVTFIHLEKHLKTHEAPMPSESGDIGRVVSADNSSEISSDDEHETSVKPSWPCIESAKNFYKCKLCPRFFVKEHNLKKHVLQRHKSGEEDSGVTYLVCKFCPKFFIKAHNLQNHVLKAHKSDSIESLKRLNENLVVHPKFKSLKLDVSDSDRFKAFVCSHCKHHFSTEFDFDSYDILYIGEGCNLQCVHCDETFVNSCCLAKHIMEQSILYTVIESHHSKLIDDDPCRKYIKCKNCDSYFEEKEVFTQHKKRFSVCVECNFCLEDNINQCGRNKHRQLHSSANNNVFKCYSCDKGFWGKTNLEEHELRYRLESVFVCSVCMLTFHTTETFLKHFQSHSPSYNARHKDNQFIENLQICSPDTGDLKCGKCEEKFPNETSMKGHSESSSELFECGTCNEACESFCRLKLHNRIHGGQGDNTILKCSNCLMYFKGVFHADVHRKTFHKYMVRCKVCDQTFNSKCRLAVHSKTHDGSFSFQEYINTNTVVFFPKKSRFLGAEYLINDDEQNVEVIINDGNLSESVRKTKTGSLKITQVLRLKTQIKDGLDKPTRNDCDGSSNVTAVDDGNESKSDNKTNSDSCKITQVLGLTTQMNDGPVKPTSCGKSVRTVNCTLKRLIGCKVCNGWFLTQSDLNDHTKLHQTSIDSGTVVKTIESCINQTPKSAVLYKDKYQII